MPGLHLQRVDEKSAEIEALVAASEGRVALADVLDDLPRRLWRTPAPGHAVHEAWRPDLADQLDLRWWPQGVTIAADADLRTEDGDLAGRRLAVVSSYAKQMPWHRDEHGSRITLLDLDRRRYRHVLLVRPRADGGLEPLHVHAGGVVWHRGHLHVAGTGKGLFTFRLDDLVRVRTPSDAFGYRYVLPLRWQYRAVTDKGTERFRYSFLSLDRSAGAPALLAGEYTDDPARTRRLATFALDPATGLLEVGPDDRTAVHHVGDGPRRMQGAANARGRLHVTVSQGRFTRGSVHAGSPDDLVRHRHATPMGNEDLAYSPDEDLLYCVSEHPLVRWVFTMRRGFFD